MVVPDAIDGWDVIRRGESQALSLAGLLLAVTVLIVVVSVVGATTGFGA